MTMEHTKQLCHFNPLPPHGGRLFPVLSTTVKPEFQSTPSTRRETLQQAAARQLYSHFNPLPPHGGRRRNCVSLTVTVSISIHSLHTEGDVNSQSRINATILFQSTPSTRRETFFHISVLYNSGISIHSLHTEGDLVFRHRYYHFCISIHSLHTEGDNSPWYFYIPCWYFNPLPPHGGRH